MTIQDFKALLRDETQEEGEYTLAELAQDAGVSPRNVMRKIAPGLADGTITKRKVRTPSHDWCYVYRYNRGKK